MVAVAVAVAVVSQRESCVKLRKTLRNYVNEAGGGPPPQSYLLLKFLGSIACGFSTQQQSHNCFDEIQIEMKQSCR